MNSELDAGRPVGGEERRAPCLDEARRAAAALGEAGASRVLVYGSLARGDKHADSDINLVAIFDDLDYKERREVKHDLCERAEEAAGREVNVHPTDWPEWTMRTQNVSSSFEAHIASYAVVLWDREPGEVPWGKPMFMAASNREEAEDILSRLSSVLYFDLRKTSEGFLDRLPELMEQPRVAWEDHPEVGMFCRDATFVLWDAVRVMVCLRGDYPPRLPRDLDFAGFVAALPPDVRAGCAPWAEEVAKIDVSYYESYCGDRVCCFPTASGSDTVEIARTLAGAAARAAIEASEQMHRALAGAGYDTICDTDFCLDVKDDAAEVLALLERWDPPIAGVAAPAAPAERAGASPAGD